MTQQFGRQLSLIVANDAGDGLDFGEFWCTFNVRRGDFQTPNSLDARIYNVKPATANKIAKTEFNTVSLSAGYPGAIGLLFQGNIIQFRQGRVNQLDSYVDITAADSDRAYNFATISDSVPAGSGQGSVRSLIASALAEKSGPQPITLNEFQPDLVPSTLVRGKVLYGMARDECRDFAWQNDCKWSLQDGKLTFIPYVAYIPGGQTPLISSKTGLIGTPEQTQAGLNIRTLLNPAIKVGQLIQLDSPINQFRFGLDLTATSTTNAFTALQNQVNSQGLYYVMVANHSGDTRGQNWYTDMVCLSVDATVTDTNIGAVLNQQTPPPIQRYGNT